MQSCRASDDRSRFEEFDRSPGAALEKITDAAGSHATNLNERVGQIDCALGEGVAQLAGALEPLTTLRDTVEELAGILANENRETTESWTVPFAGDPLKQAKATSRSVERRLGQESIRTFASRWS